MCRILNKSYPTIVFDLWIIIGRVRDKVQGVHNPAAAESRTDL